ncbi:hypothetical protein Acsp04_50930 [Actinomadura sp. NBRC 104425]|nr:hypothetical protein Acsp04_50930 [Actinomadura sp. NBRC 104425]
MGGEGNLGALCAVGGGTLGLASVPHPLTSAHSESTTAPGSPRDHVSPPELHATLDLTRNAGVGMAAGVSVQLC